MLNFDKQIKNMCMKAARQLNVLQRLSKFLSVETRLLIFKSFIQSNFNYCPLVWHFCSKANTEKLEKLQYRALRIVFHDYISSYESLLSKVNLPTLHMNRLRCIATETVLGHFGHGHFGLGRFGLDISATDVSATENTEGGRFGQNHKFWVWDVCMHKCVMHFIIF